MARRKNTMRSASRPRRRAAQTRRRATPAPDTRSSGPVRDDKPGARPAGSPRAEAPVPATGSAAAEGRARAKPQPAFVTAPGMLRPHHASPYQRAATDPVHRALRIYTQDPATSRLDFAVAAVDVPYEPLSAGPRGSLVHVVDYNETRRESYDPIDLNDPRTAMERGLPPSTANPAFAQQMVYAVTMLTYDRFRQALGRTPDFAFDPAPDDAARAGSRPTIRLQIRPHAFEEDNAWYDREAGELAFGYTFANPQAIGGNQPGGVVFTALSHDVVVHEMTHALLDGMRAHFLLPSNPDVGAFHEGFADLVALFQRFRYGELVKRAIEHASGGLDSRLLTDIARQFGQATSDGRQPLRSALRAKLPEPGKEDEPVDKTFRYDPDDEEHDLGAVLVAAVFEAFRRVFQRKTTQLRRLAERAGGPLLHEFVELIAHKAESLASQFLNIIIRAVDYCPPVDVTFGEYLRAIVTADFEVVPDDPWCYREAFVQAFRRYDVAVDGVADLSEEALLWKPPERSFGPVDGLQFARLRHGSDPGRHPPAEEQERRARVLGGFITADPQRLWYFGLATPGPQKNGLVEPPVVQSIRTLRRSTPDGDVVLELVAEITQRRKTKAGYWMYGGTTVVIGTDGTIRYAVNKNVNSERRERTFLQYLRRMPSDYDDEFRTAAPRPSRVLRRLHRRMAAREAGARAAAP
jgi:hypothetical protein